MSFILLRGILSGAILSGTSLLYATLGETIARLGETPQPVDD